MISDVGLQCHSQRSAQTQQLSLNFTGVNQGCIFIVWGHISKEEHNQFTEQLHAVVNQVLLLKKTQKEIKHTNKQKTFCFPNTVAAQSGGNDK